MANSNDKSRGRFVIEMEKNYIFTIPSTLRGNDGAFTPKVVSIGPLHHGLDKKYRQMESKKMRYQDICSSYNPNITLEDLRRSVKELEERVRRTYDQTHFREFSSNEFVDMMLLDGCFIIQLFLFRWNGSEVSQEYDREMFENEFHHKNVQNDLRLAENQLPFFLLDHLFNLIFTDEQRRPTDEQRGPISFIDLTMKNFQRYVKLGGNVLDKSDAAECVHFGEILLKCFLPSTTYKEYEDKSYGYLPTASELHNKWGIEIKKSDSPNLLDITFSNGVLEIPKITISRSVRSTFRNIIAMEQCHRGTYRFVTDYALFLDYLVDTKEDVALLKSCEVIDSIGANDKDVAKIIETMTNGVLTAGTKHSYYYGVIHEIHVYKNQRCNQFKASLNRELLTGPLRVASLSAAFVGLVLTVIATVFTVLSFASR